MAKSGSGARRIATLAAATAVATVCVVSMVLFVSGREHKSVKEMERFVGLHPRIVEVVGSPVTARDVVEEHFQKNPEIGAYSRLAVTLAGPKGSATAKVVLRKGKGPKAPWHVDELELAVPGGAAEKLDCSLVPPPPPEPTKSKDDAPEDGAGG